MRRSRPIIKSYFEITEDPPQLLPALRKTQRPAALSLPRSAYFFIDFTEECQLRLMKKMEAGQFGSAQPLEMEQFGRNVIINVEDSSPLEGQLVKYEEQHRSIREKRSSIEGKVKETLQRSKHKARSKSVMMIKQELLEEYSQSFKVLLY